MVNNTIKSLTQSATSGRQVVVTAVILPGFTVISSPRVLGWLVEKVTYDTTNYTRPSVTDGYVTRRV